MLKNWRVCLLAHWGLIFAKLCYVSEIPTVPSCSRCWMSKKKTSDRSNINWAFIQSVLMSKGMKLGIPWPRRAVWICKQKYWWIFRNSSRMAHVRKIAEISKGSNEISSCTNTAAVLWCCPWSLLQAYSRKQKKSAFCSRRMATNLTVLVTSLKLLTHFTEPWQTCESFLCWYIPWVLTRNKAGLGFSAHQWFSTNSLTSPHDPCWALSDLPRTCQHPARTTSTSPLPKYLHCPCLTATVPRGLLSRPSPRARCVHSHCSRMPASWHLRSRHSWHLRRMYMSISHLPPFLQTYCAPLMTLRRKKPLQPSQLSTL